MKKHYISDILFDIDYNSKNGNNEYVSDISFSYLAWNILERLIEVKVPIEEVDEQNLKFVNMIILPDC